MNKAPIVYYMPFGKSNEEIIERCNLGKGSKANPFNGPHGLTGGTIISPYKNVVFCDIDEYKWSKIKDGCFIGINSDLFNPVGRFKFERLKDVDKAREVLLADGKVYVLPVARLGSKDFGLPVIERLDEFGNVFSEPIDGYDKVIDLADRVFNAMMDDGFLDATDDDVRETCVTCLSLFYDLNKEEMFALGLFNNDSYVAIIEALIDRPTLKALAEAESKKKIETKD